MKVWQGVLAFFTAIVAITVLSFWGSGLSLFLKKTFGVADANVNRQIFEQSQSYNEGMLRDLEHMESQYLTADAGGKAALKALVIHRFEVFPEDKLTPELRRFYTQLRATP